MSDIEGTKETVCTDCKKSFHLTEGEVYFYTTTISDKGTAMKFPKRCRGFRNLRKKSHAP